METIFNGTIAREDVAARKWLSQLDTKIQTLSERSKRQTIQIRELQKQIKSQKNSSASTGGKQ